MRNFLTIASILMGSLNPLIVSAQINESVASGYAIMIDKQTGNCIACHALPGMSGLPSDFGPSLKGVGAKWRPPELLQWVVDARKIKPDTLMPPFGNSEGLSHVSQSKNLLSNAQINAVVSTLESWR